MIVSWIRRGYDITWRGGFTVPMHQEQFLAPGAGSGDPFRPGNGLGTGIGNGAKESDPPNEDSLWGTKVGDGGGLGPGYGEGDDDCWWGDCYSDDYPYIAVELRWTP